MSGGEKKTPSAFSSHVKRVGADSVRCFIKSHETGACSGYLDRLPFSLFAILCRNLPIWSEKRTSLGRRVSAAPLLFSPESTEKQAVWIHALHSFSSQTWRGSGHTGCAVRLFRCEPTGRLPPVSQSRLDQRLRTRRLDVPAVHRMATS